MTLLFILQAIRYSSDFKETAKILGEPDLAAIPIGAYEPRDFMKPAHINPEEAVKVFNDLGQNMRLVSTGAHSNSLWSRWMSRLSASKMP